MLSGYSEVTGGSGDRMFSSSVTTATGFNVTLPYAALVRLGGTAGNCLYYTQTQIQDTNTQTDIHTHTHTP